MTEHMFIPGKLYKVVHNVPYDTTDTRGNPKYLREGDVVMYVEHRPRRTLHKLYGLCFLRCTEVVWCTVGTWDHAVPVAYANRVLSMYFEALT